MRLLLCDHHRHVTYRLLKYESCSHRLEDFGNDDGAKTCYAEKYSTAERTSACADLSEASVNQDIVPFLSAEADSLTASGNDVGANLYEAGTRSLAIDHSVAGCRKMQTETGEVEGNEKPCGEHVE